MSTGDSGGSPKNFANSPQRSPADVDVIVEGTLDVGVRVTLGAFDDAVNLKVSSWIRCSKSSTRLIEL